MRAYYFLSSLGLAAAQSDVKDVTLKSWRRRLVNKKDGTIRAFGHYGSNYCLNFHPDESNEAYRHSSVHFLTHSTRWVPLGDPNMSNRRVVWGKNWPLFGSNMSKIRVLCILWYLIDSTHAILRISTKSVS